MPARHRDAGVQQESVAVVGQGVHALERQALRLVEVAPVAAPAASATTVRAPLTRTPERLPATPGSSKPMRSIVTLLAAIPMPDLDAPPVRFAAREYAPGAVMR